MLGGGDADDEFSDFLEFLADDDPREDIESTAATNENDGGREKDDESSSSEGYDDFLTYLNKFQRACDANSPMYVDKYEGAHGGGGDGQISSEDEELDHIGEVEVNEDMLQHWAQDGTPEPPRWRFVDTMKKTFGYSSADAGTVVEGV